MKHPVRLYKLISPVVSFLVVTLFLNYHVSAQSNTCAAATPILSATTCIAGTSQLASQSLVSATASSPVVATSCTGTPGADVWYQFTAQTVNPTITLSNIGSSFKNNATRIFIQVLKAGPVTACTGMTEESCVRSTGTVFTTLASAQTGLTVGQVYFIRIYTLTAAPTGATWGYTICVTDPAPDNDLCSNAASLTPTLVCSNTHDNFYAATVSTPPTITGSCAGTVTYDLWYSFVATATNATVTMSNIGTDIASPGVELLTGTCATTMTSLACGSTAVSSYALTIGTTYYIRTYSGGTAPTDATDAGFDICVTYAGLNDLCGGAYPINSSPTCSNIFGTLTGATYTTQTGACGAGTPAGNRNDVWYKFVAKTTNPTITLSSSPTQRSIQLFSGVCGSLTSKQCAVNSTTMATSALTVGTTYYVRIWSDNNTTGTFGICITDPAPANDLCTNATLLPTATTCSNTAGNLYASTVLSSPPITGTCAGTVVNDVWYKFVASAAYVTINLSSVGAGITNPGMELLAGDCTGMYSMFCGTSNIGGAGLVIGSTYYLRVYSTGTAPTTSTNAGFNVCITYVAPPPPPNDDCLGAINLPVNGSCSNIVGTVSSSTASTGFPTGCAATPTAYDVWYKFTAINSNTTTIALSSFGAGFAGTQSMQLFSGTCGALTSLACGTTSIAAAVTQGTTYYVRVYTTTGPAPTTDGDFKICVSTTSPPPRIGNSYVNLSKNTVGGVVQAGDTLEIRMTVVSTSALLYSTRYLDNIPTKTAMMALPADSIRIITNEGLTYKNYTPLPTDDAATYVAAPTAGVYNIRINLGQDVGNWPTYSTTNTVTDLTGTGNLPGTGNPRGGGGIMFATSFRVKVTGVVGDTIKLNGGKFIYRTAAGGPDITLSGTPYQILITNPLTLCANAKGVNNATEFGGTFGSGTTLNRGTDLNFPIPGYSLVNVNGSAQVIGDGQYAIIDNSSPLSGTNSNASRKPTCPTPGAPDMLCANRMFGGYWYIKGDHSGTSNAAGNSPAASGSPGGYMLAVNADYVASEAYRQTLTGLCPNTYYEFSAWFQNICPVCGIDSVGAQFAGTVTSPANGYPGVYPNLSFSLDGLDRYSTGRIDTMGWIKKGFVFLTGPAQTSATLSIRNNAQGGGGNDWVMDDISIATCFPSMSYSPTATPVVCKGNTITIGDTVRSQFSNYTYYVWQRSQDNGVTWANITSTQSATPVLSGSQYQYITSYSVPPSATNPADSGDIYRVYTATTIPNITSANCVANDGSAPIVLSVLNCFVALKTDLLSFNGNLMNKNAVLSWTTSKEDDAVHFELQSSDNNINFTTIAALSGKNSGDKVNYYSFIDPQLVQDKRWYRLVLIENNGSKKYSHIIQLSTTPSDFEVDNVINPFSEQLLFNLIVNKSSKVTVELIDMQGKILKSNSYLVYTGVNNMRIQNTDSLSAGIYTLRIQNNGSVISKKVMKKNN